MAIRLTQRRPLAVVQMVTHHVGQHVEGGVLAVHHGQTGRRQEPVDAGSKQGLLGEQEDTTNHNVALMNVLQRWTRTPSSRNKGSQTETHF